MSRNKLASVILEENLTEDEVKDVVRALVTRGYIVKAIMPETEEAESLAHFLKRFWTWDKSPYIQRKVRMGQCIHKRYTKNMLGRVKRYWIPVYGRRPIGSITKSDIQKVMDKLVDEKTVMRTTKDSHGHPIIIEKKLKPETINQITRSITLPLRWAYEQQMITNDCFSGLTYCKIARESRHILSISQAKRLFKTPWNDRSARLASMVAMYTGMRIGEVQALQVQDLEGTTLHVRHNWARADGLKEPKNGEVRDVKINDYLRKKLEQQIRKNPYGQSPTDFIFYGYLREVPVNCKHWNEELHKAMKAAEIEDEKVTFHSWRHFYATMMADVVDPRKVQIGTGHKSSAVLEQYANHESEKTLKVLGQKAEQLFGDIACNQNKGRS